MSEIASALKITYHKEKLESYLRNEPIFPATLELDLTNVCNRKCPDCPSTTSLKSNNLKIDFVESLFSCLEGQTKGLLLTGGEPTMAPTFSDALRMSREYGFTEVVVVTNGTYLNEEKVASALLTYASAIRVSLYDWSTESCGGLYPTLKQIETLRSRIDREGSELQIGVSALTSEGNSDALSMVSREAASAGAHWIYFHPMCIRWNTGEPARVAQEGVLSKIAECQKSAMDHVQVFSFRDRYVESNIEFERYHAANFLLIIGADGMNYLGAEVKYQPQYVIADLASNLCDDFLWQKQRLKRIRMVDSKTYPAIASRHRGVLYNGLIEQLIRLRQDKITDESRLLSKKGFLFPHIL